MPISDYTPTIAQVGALLRARTKDRYGNEVGTFTDSTRPTAETATELIQEAVEELGLNIGYDLPDAKGNDKDAVRKSALRVATILSGMNIEMSLFPDSVDRANGQSTYAALERRYNRLFPLLLSAIEEAGGDVSGEEVDSGGLNAAYGKPSYDFGDQEITTFDERF